MGVAVERPTLGVAGMGYSLPEPGRVVGRPPVHPMPPKKRSALRARLDAFLETELGFGLLILAGMPIFGASFAFYGWFKGLLIYGSFVVLGHLYLVWKVLEKRAKGYQTQWPISTPTGPARYSAQDRRLYLLAEEWAVVVIILFLSLVDYLKPKEYLPAWAWWISLAAATAHSTYRGHARRAKGAPPPEPPPEDYAILDQVPPPRFYVRDRTFHLWTAFVAGGLVVLAGPLLIAATQDWRWIWGVLAATGLTFAAWSRLMARASRVEPIPQLAPLS